jgi:lipoate-protein ligase A
MAVDEALLASQQPTLRLYGWEPGITLGRFQKAHAVLDAAKVPDSGLDITRRMTGGGALVHGGDLSYALVLPRALLGGLGVKESYRHLCGFLVHLYTKLGLEAQFAADAGVAGASSPLCLASNEPYDIVVNGQKMGGNAQRYTKTALLMHGSIPMRLEPERFAGVFTGDAGLERAGSLARLNVPIGYTELARLAAESFSQSFGADLEAVRLGDKEAALADTLAAQKYTTKQWIFDGES